MNDEIIEILKSKDWPKRKSEVAKKLSVFPQKALFDTLFDISTKPQWVGPSACASCMLLLLNPKCTVDVKTAIERTLEEWDVSLEELPFYLAQQFGKGAIEKAISELENHKSGDELQRLHTIRYWLTHIKENSA
jgi:hypothetical protein